MKCTRTVSHLAPSTTAPALATTRIDCQYKQAIDARLSSSAHDLTTHGLTHRRPNFVQVAHTPMTAMFLYCVAA